MKAIAGLAVLVLASNAAGEDPEERRRAHAEVSKNEVTPLATYSSFSDEMQIVFAVLQVLKPVKQRPEV